MKNLPWLITISVVIICCYIVFRKPSATEREKSLESQVKALLTEDSKKATRLNMLTTEIDQLKQEKATEHEASLQYQAEATAYRLKYLRRRDGVIPHYTESAWDARAKEVARGWRHNPDRF